MLQEENILIYFALNWVGSKSAVLTTLEPSIYPKNRQCQDKFLLQPGVSILLWRELGRRAQPLVPLPLLPAHGAVWQHGHLHRSRPAKIWLLIFSSLKMLRLGWAWMSARRMNSTEEFFQIKETTHPHSSACKYFRPTYAWEENCFLGFTDLDIKC